MGRGILFCSLDDESHVSCPPGDGERSGRRDFVFMKVEDVQVPKGNQIITTFHRQNHRKHLWKRINSKREM
jgi:hypothetical protein